VNQLSFARAVRLGASLRWRLARNRLRKGGLWLFVLVVALASLGGLLGAVLFASGRALEGTDREALYVVGFTVLVLGWVFVPITGGGADETVDPTRLALLPLTRKELLGVLLGAAASGPATIAVLVALLGVPIGAAPAGPGAIVVVLAVPVMFALGLGCARLAAAALVRAQRSRRGRDLGVAVSAIAGVTLWLATQSVGPVLQQGSDTANGVVSKLAWLPFAWPAEAVVAASNGQLFRSLLWLAASIVITGGVLYAWATLSARLLAQPERTVAAAGTPRGAPLGRARTPFGAALAKEFRYSLRSPGRRVQLLLGTVMGTGFAVIQTFNTADRHEPGLVLFGLWGSVFTIAGAFNVVGFDAPSLWLEVNAGGITRTQLLARTVSWTPHVLLPALVSSLVLTAIVGDATYLALALVLVVDFGLIGLAGASVVSAVAPVTATDGDNPFAWRTGMSGKGCVTGIYILLGVLMVVVLAAPYAVPALVWRAEGWSLPLALAGLPWGAMWWWLGLRAGARRLDGRGPELIAELSPRSLG
jgi:ABC-2 type transport system permease protein